MESKKYKSVINAEEEHLMTMSTTTSTKTVKKSLKTTKTKQSLEKLSSKESKSETISSTNAQELGMDTVDATAATTPPTPPTPTGEDAQARKKVKSKKSKKCEYDNQNISVKTSFNKFDALQKRNLIHNPQDEQQTSCRLCNKAVYKMEEVKAEKGIYHKTCFRCHECSKQLKFDNYQIHEGTLYCTAHFKLLFAPKVVEDVDPKPRKAELIIRESQPVELPPDVVRASDKPDLGLEELQQLNVRSRFQVFEGAGKRREEEEQQLQRQNTVVKRSTSILSKVAKLQQHGLNSSIDMKSETAENQNPDESGSGSENSDSDIENVDDNVEDADLVRSKRRTQKERPVGLGDAMNDIKTRFETGHVQSKEERREERKQEIQNIRSRLFMGKQAKFKEMYQQAVADSEQSITSVGKKPEVEIGAAARSIKERFEKGEMFNEKGGSSNLSEDADVFESAISKRSRSIFMELDANAEANGEAATLDAQNELKKNRSGLLRKSNSQVERDTANGNDQNNVDVVKYDEKPEDVKIATSEISEKFKFFETYRPNEGEKRKFRMTPPREGVVKMPTSDSDSDEPEKSTFNDNVLQKTQTTSTMLNKFREMEQKKFKGSNESNGPKPLKCFTPPPEDRRRYYDNQNSEDDESEESNSEDESANEDEPQEFAKLSANDEALKEAQNAARAKKLRAKFEKWQANEIQRELNEGHVDIYSQQVSDDSTIESTKTIRERFENMKNFERKSPSGPRYQVNRFV
ncbi:LIM domain and actin-binding protein 1 isoform X2 [Scaptodrosophila lebanonensis]|uniref:LIM domain and actin-binding protein 1 isoform X2 n=1 Tax=Drosophila lebanonensis TaxID=7225 RepID=A0A6J2TSG3_DROLE|nr:LIM domain and actin-binding protein 1 isoform X2 [Scaptodrosophila lebanonensis]